MLNKKYILYSISTKLKGKVSNFFIVGSFLKEDWNSENSDIDLVCVDVSFEEYSYFENKKFVKNESVAKVKTILQLDNWNVDFKYGCKILHEI